MKLVKSDQSPDQVGVQVAHSFISVCLRAVTMDHRGISHTSDMLLSCPVRSPRQFVRYVENLHPVICSDCWPILHQNRPNLGFSHHEVPLAGLSGMIVCSAG